MIQANAWKGSPNVKLQITLDRQLGSTQPRESCLMLRRGIVVYSRVRRCDRSDYGSQGHHQSQTGQAVHVHRFSHVHHLSGKV
jgi:hypothetical protein